MAMVASQMTSKAICRFRLTQKLRFIDYFWWHPTDGNEASQQKRPTNYTTSFVLVGAKADQSLTVSYTRMRLHAPSTFSKNFTKIFGPCILSVLKSAECGFFVS